MEGVIMGLTISLWCPTAENVSEPLCQRSADVDICPKEVVVFEMVEYDYSCVHQQVLH
jgi:hypothetical protein